MKMNTEAEKMPEWLKKCITCKYSYAKKNDDHYIGCKRIKFGECKEKIDGQTEEK